MFAERCVEVALLDRFQRIRSEFGMSALVRTLVLLIGLAGMGLLGLLAFSTAAAALLASVGLALGLLLRGVIARGVDYYPRVITAGLFVYGIVLSLGELIDLNREIQLLFIAATTVVMFNLQFWSLSDPSVENAERHNRG